MRLRKWSIGVYAALGLALCLTGCGQSEHGSLTLCLPLDFHNPLHYSPLRLIFLSNFCFFSVLFCTLVV